MKKKIYQNETIKTPNPIKYDRIILINQKLNINLKM